MSFKIVRTFPGPATEPWPVTEYEQEAASKVGATIEVVPARRTRYTAEELLSVSREADAVITETEPFTRRVLEQLEKCRVIAGTGVGYQDIDVEAATDYGICVSNNPWYCLEEVSDHAMALLLGLARKINLLDKVIHAGTQYIGVELARVRGQLLHLRGQTLGLVGFGNIPRAVVPKAKGFGLRIIAYDPYVSVEVMREAGVEPVDFDWLLAESDYISVHAALTSKNRGMFKLEQFQKMKPTAFFINTARGALVDSSALYTALTEGLLAGAGLDVTEPEPINPDNPLLKLENVIVTGHSAAVSVTSMIEIRKFPIEEVALVLSGKWPRALLNPPVKGKFLQRWGRPQAYLPDDQDDGTIRRFPQKPDTS